jgi:hypothetical protein
MKKRKKRDRFRVIIPCKPYVKAYLLANFNRPDEDWPEIVNFADDKMLHDYFLSLLKRGEERYDSRLKGTRYTAQVSIEITYDQFQRYGWMLTLTDTVKFNTFLERRVKQMLYFFVGTLHVTGLPLMECVRRFRTATKISEWDWDTDSIRKDLQRHLTFDTTAYEEFLRKIEEKVWSTMSEVGTMRAAVEPLHTENGK